MSRHCIVLLWCWCRLLCWFCWCF